MFEERTDMNDNTMPPDIEALLAADEAAIADDGFSERVAAKLETSSIAREVTIYGAGLMGFGFAVGSLPALVNALPPLKLAVKAAMKTPDLANIDLTRLSSWSPDSQSTLLVASAVVAMAFTSLMLVLRER